jgi:hypothetical protein
VVLSGADALVSAADIHKMLANSGVQVSGVLVLDSVRVPVARLAKYLSA